MKKTKLTLFVVNLLLFMAIVYMGIMQAGMGAQIVNIQKETALHDEKHQQLTDSIFNSNNLNVSDDQLLSMNFKKPSDIYYFDIIDSLAKLPVR